MSEIGKIFLLINQNLRYFYSLYYTKFKHDLLVSFIKCLSKSKDNTLFSIHIPGCDIHYVVQMSYHHSLNKLVTQGTAVFEKL